MRNEMQNALNEARSLEGALLRHSTVTLEQCFEQFQEETPEFFQYFSQTAVWAMYALAEEKMNETGNPPSVSLFVHCFGELKAVGLQKLRGPLPKPGHEEPDESEMTSEQFLRVYRSLSASRLETVTGAAQISNVRLTSLFRWVRFKGDRQ